MEKYIKTFEDHTTNTHVVGFKDLSDWSADRVVNNKNGKFSYIKIDNEWVRKDNISRTEQSNAIWMTEEESLEFNELYSDYLRVSNEYKEKLNSYRPTKIRMPDNRVW